MFARVKQLSRLIQAVFPIDFLRRAIPAFTIIIGLAVFAIGYVVFPQETHPAWHDATKSLGLAILVSGFVSVLLTALTYIGIFQKAIFDVLYGGDYLKTHSNLPDVLNRIISAISQNKFPEVTQQLSNQMISKYIPSPNTNFIYSRYDRECLIGWSDRANFIAKWTETIDIVLRASSPDEQIVYAYQCSADSRTPREIARVIIDLLDIDGVDHKHSDSLEEVEYVDEFGGKGLRFSYAIPLTGKLDYKVRRTLTRNICLLKDPIIECGAQRYIGATTLKVHSETPELKVVFVGSGNDEFKDVPTIPFWSIHKVLNSALFPNQGFIIFVQYVQQETITPPRVTIAQASHS